MNGIKFENNFAEGLQRLSKAIGENALRAAGYAGAEVLKDEMIARVPIKTGVIERNIIVKRAVEQCDGDKRQVYLATVRAGAFNVEGDAFYWRWVEDGHKFVRKRKSKGKRKEAIKVARMASELEYGTVKKGARPFMRPAWEAQKTAALEAVRDKLKEKISESLG